MFGIWLALDDYSIVDGWILIALVLWAIAGAARACASAWRSTPGTGERVRPLYAVMTIAVVALLVVMIYKPGA